jgi:hypothetical protein
VIFGIQPRKVGTRPKGTLRERLQSQLSLSLGSGITSTQTLITLVRAAALVIFVLLLGILVGMLVLLGYFIVEVLWQQPPQALPLFERVIIAFEFAFFTILISITLTRSLLVAIHLKRFFHSEYLNTWSLLYHRVLGPELAVEDFWRPLYTKPTAFSTLKFPSYSKNLEDHLRFLAAFLDALRDCARGPQKVFYLHWVAGHMRIRRYRMRKVLWIIISLYPLIAFIPLWRMQPLYWYWIILGYLAYLLLAVCAFLLADGPLELQHRARTRALCEFFLDEGGPDPATLPPPPEIFGSPLRRWWVMFYERIVRFFHWRGGAEE